MWIGFVYETSTKPNETHTLTHYHIQTKKHLNNVLNVFNST